MDFPKDYSIENGIMDIMGGADSVVINDDCVIKDRGGTVSVYIPSNNAKGHNSYDMRYGSGGKLSGFDPHKTN